MYINTNVPVPLGKIKVPKGYIERLNKLWGWNGSEKESRRKESRREESRREESRREERRNSKAKETV